MLFDAVQENSLEKKGIKRNIEIFHPRHVVVVGEVGVKEDPEHDFDDQQRNGRRTSSVSRCCLQMKMSDECVLSSATEI